MSEVEVEEWRTIVGFEDYEASSLGRVRSKDRMGKRGKMLAGRALSQSGNGNGYRKVVLYPKSPRCTFAYVHRCVLLAFDGEPKDGDECRHRDGNKANNVRTNLVWGSHTDNMADAIGHGTMPKGSSHCHAKLSEFKVRAALALLHQGATYQMVAKALKVSFGTIQQMAVGNTWKHVQRPEGFISKRRTGFRARGGEVRPFT